MGERRPSAWDNAMPFRELLIMVVGAISLVRAVLWLAFGHSKPGGPTLDSLWLRSSWLRSGGSFPRSLRVRKVGRTP
jgi:hypothetical protein